MKLTLLALAFAFCTLTLPLPAQQTFLYSAGSGDTTCKFHTNAPTPTTVNFLCTNPRGTFGGYYAPAAASTATDVITMGLSSNPTANTGNEVCMMAVNMTAASVTIGSFGVVPPASIIFQCAGGAASPILSLMPTPPPPATSPAPASVKKQPQP